MSERELREQITALQRQITTMSQYLGAVCEEVLQLQARVQELVRKAFPKGTAGICHVTHHR